jgi:hypothetical protein
MTWAICRSFHPWIHPEDADAAIHAHLKQSRKRRVSEQYIVEDFFIASLVNNRPWNERQLKRVTEILQDPLANKNFYERLQRALETNKPPTWDQLDNLILSNWRELHINPIIQAKVEAQEGKLPGLQDWSPRAVVGLFQLQGIESRLLQLRGIESESPETLFTQRRKRLGLAGKYPHAIKDFIVVDSSVRIVR